MKIYRFRIRRILAALCALVFVVTALASCSLKSSAEDLKVVGTVAGYDVLYEELRFLASSYKKGLEDKYGEYENLSADKTMAFDEELRELVYTNIVTNYAILSICKENGLALDDEGLDKRVDEKVESVIKNDFGGKKKEYKKSLEEYGITDHYYRFTVSVDLLYSDLLIKLINEGKIENDSEKIADIVKKEFVRTWHIMVTNDSGEDTEANRAKIEEALSKYRDGSMGMYELIGSKYNEDYSLTELDGFYFAKGSMDADYENAAFSLDVGEVSDVVEAMGTNTKGETVSAFYIIQRLEIEDEYVKENIGSLSEKYQNAAVYSMLEKKKTEINFIPNEFAKSLILSQIGSER